MELVEAIKRMVLPLIKKNQRRGKATNIDTDKCICDVDLGNGASLHNVKLKAIESGSDKGIVIVPKDKSYVVAAMVEGVEADWCLVQWDEIDSAAFFFKQGGKMELKDDGKILLNGDACGELVKIQELKDNLDAIKNYLTAEKSAIAAGFNAVGAAMAANGANGATAFNTAMASQSITYSDMKNDKVKHGTGS